MADDRTAADGAAPMREETAAKPTVELPVLNNQLPVLNNQAGCEKPGFQLPNRVPVQKYRKAQSNIPDSRKERDRLKLLCARHVEAERLVPPLSMLELREHAVKVREQAEVDAIFDDYLSILVNNAVWRDALAQIPYERRLLLVPKCLRVEEHCPAPFDEFGLLCKECGLCSIQDLTVEAERLGYAVLVAEGSAIVRAMIETGRIEAIVGVSCINVLEKCFPHMEAAAVPGAAIPLLQDDCVNTTVDLDWVWDLIHLTSDDETYRLDLDKLRDDVQSWFARDELDRLLGPVDGETEEIARAWMAQEGKRWRPYLSTCVYLAIRHDGKAEDPTIPDDFKRLAIAVECFHKASLIHDDIEDGDDERYGTPTLHKLHGEAVAINVGDFLLGEGYRLLSNLDVPSEARVDMMRAASAGHVTLSRGQGTELLWTRNPKTLPSTDVLRIFEEKTAPAFQVALWLAATYAGADMETQGVLAEYSRAIGIAYQIKDDLEDYDGGSDSNDLMDVRPSLLLSIAAKKLDGKPDGALIDDLIARRRSFDEIGADVRRALVECGATAKSQELQSAYQEEAVRSLRFLGNATLKGLLRRVVHKIFPQVLIEGLCSEFEARNAAGGAAGAQAPR